MQWIFTAFKNKQNPPQNINSPSAPPPPPPREETFLLSQLDAVSSCFYRSPWWYPTRSATAGTTSTSKAKVEAGTSTTSQGRSCLEVHILDGIPQLGFSVALQHPCPKEIYPSPSSATPYYLFFEEPKTVLVDTCQRPCTFTELRPEWWRPAFILCCGKGKHTPEKWLRCATETAQQQKFFWKPRIYCSAAFIL